MTFDFHEWDIAYLLTIVRKALGDVVNSVLVVEDSDDKDLSCCKLLMREMKSREGRGGLILQC